jgi:hypothetical protein
MGEGCDFCVREHYACRGGSLTIHSFDPGELTPPCTLGPPRRQGTATEEHASPSLAWRRRTDNGLRSRVPFKG